MTIPTVASLRRANARAERVRRGAALVLTALQRGQSLNLSYERRGRRWRLSDGRPVADDVAKLIIDDHRIAGVGRCALSRHAGANLSLGGGLAGVEPGRPIYRLRLRPLPGTDAIRALRGALKVLVRKFRLQCISIEQEGNEDGGETQARDRNA